MPSAHGASSISTGTTRWPASRRPRARGREITAIERPRGFALPAALEGEGRTGQPDRRGDRGGKRHRQVPGHGELGSIREELGEAFVVHAFMMDGACFAVGTPRRQADEAKVASV